MNALGARPRGLLAAGVSLEGIEASFRDVPAVRGIDLAVAPGEFLALVGPSGAGKTTLLRIVAGLQPGHAGTVAIGGRDVTRLPARARNIGLVFQNYALFGHMSVAENVAFGLRVRPRATRPERAAIMRRVGELLELVQVGGLAGRRPGQLSGGQRQRVALARALATEPALLLLDEPFGALDPLVRKEIRTWLRGLHDQLGLTSILVTHDQGEAVEIADRIAVLRDGRLEQVGRPDELEDHPANAFVHRFLGERVAFQGTISGGEITLDDDRGLVRTRREVADGRVLVSIRPWQIGLSRGGGEPEGTIAGIHRAGMHLRYEVRMRERTIEVLAPASGEVFRTGERVAFDLGAAQVFAGRNADQS